MRQRPPIIALAGPDRVGKSTLANELIAELYYPGHSDDSTRHYVDGFGRPLREAAHLLCPCEPKSEGWRNWMRDAGEKARELRGQSVLIDLLEHRVSCQFDKPASSWSYRDNVCVIDDLRTDDEAKWVHAHRGVVIELQRDGVTYSGHSLDSRLHPTLIDAVVPVGDKTETARHILGLTGWL
jgi:GTPase SAR1 family protein